MFVCVRITIGGVDGVDVATCIHECWMRAFAVDVFVACFAYNHDSVNDIQRSICTASKCGWILFLARWDAGDTINNGNMGVCFPLLELSMLGSGVSLAETFIDEADALFELSELILSFRPNFVALRIRSNVNNTSIWCSCHMQGKREHLHRCSIFRLNVKIMRSWLAEWLHVC